MGLSGGSPRDNLGLCESSELRLLLEYGGHAVVLAVCGELCSFLFGFSYLING